MDLEAPSDLTESFFFSEVRKRTLQSRFCSVLCDTTNGQDTLLNCGGIVVPWGPYSLYVTFAPTIDDTLGTSLPKEIRIALRSHKVTFYQGCVVLTVAASIMPSPPSLF